MSANVMSREPSGEHFNDLDTTASLAEVLQPVQEAKMQIGHLIERI